jgi:23S rRNA pseudouridine2604 synthase
MEKIRLSKIMAERGLCSRREADHYIERGWVYVDGERVTTLGIKIAPDQAIRLDKKARSLQEQAVTVLLNKPIGYVSGQPEKNYPTAVSLIRKTNRYRKDRSRNQFVLRQLRGLAPAGRLDIDSQGLLVLTQDGRIARQLIGENSGIEKEYLVRIQGTVDERGLKLLNHGLSLDGKPLKPARVSRLNRDQLRFVLTQGKKRQIRRMCEQVGLEITGLKRIRIGKVALGLLPVGQWRYLGENERF